MLFTLKIDIKKTENALPHSYLWFNKKKTALPFSAGQKAVGFVGFLCSYTPESMQYFVFLFPSESFQGREKALHWGFV